MSQIERIFDIPDWEWTEHCYTEYTAAEENIPGLTDFIWRVGNHAVVGFTYHSWLSPPWMWFLLAKHINLGHLLDFRRLKERIPRGTLTAVKADFELGLRFAKLYGFADTGATMKSRDLDYKIFRRV